MFGQTKGFPTSGGAGLKSKRCVQEVPPGLNACNRWGISHSQTLRQLVAVWLCAQSRRFGQVRWQAKTVTPAEAGAQANTLNVIGNTPATTVSGLLGRVSNQTGSPQQCSAKPRGSRHRGARRLKSPPKEPAGLFRSPAHRPDYAGAPGATPTKPSGLRLRPELPRPIRTRRRLLLRRTAPKGASKMLPRGFSRLAPPAGQFPKIHQGQSRPQRFGQGPSQDARIGGLGEVARAMETACPSGRRP
jgi:hypothetical protein